MVKRKSATRKVNLTNQEADLMLAGTSSSSDTDSELAPVTNTSVNTNTGETTQTDGDTTILELQFDSSTV